MDIPFVTYLFALIPTVSYCFVKNCERLEMLAYLNRCVIDIQVYIGDIMGLVDSKACGDLAGAGFCLQFVKKQNTHL